MTAATQTPGVSFLRRRSTRVVLGAASVAGFTLLGSAPAFAATEADCTTGNSLDAGAGDTAADIQALLDANTSVICLSGLFDVDTSLFADYELTLFGLSDAVLDGGGDTQILSVASSDVLTVQNITFSNGDSNEGGAINAYNVAAIDSRFEGNFSDFRGGAIWAYTVYSDGSTFVDNESAFGGAIYGDQGVEVVDSTFTGNSAEYGGAIFTYSADITASTFDTNSAQYLGGAVLADDEATVTNSTFVGNTAGDLGGAVLVEDGTILQSTFLDNTADLGQAVTAWDAGILELRGNIFAGSGSAPQIGVTDGATAFDLGGNIFSTTELDEIYLSVEPVEGAEVAEGSVDSGFGLSSALIFDGATLADNGGATQTIALYAGSPAVDAVPAGDPSVAVDQRGETRSVPGDAGAYEFIAAISPDKPALAATGSEVSGWAAGAAGALLAAGAAVVATARRRRA